MTKAIYFAGDKYIKMFSSSNTINFSAIPTSAIIKNGASANTQTAIGDQRIALCGIEIRNGVFYYLSEDSINTDVNPNGLVDRWLLSPQALKDIKWNR
ncbi:hypothetical protein [Lactobacillus intestinalis]|uniref:hypothetical protein n=1 Tax=Lactobacillus intestinalis TaxID=151781 RepID=UPI0002C8B1DA|nr:hypothetical protein [Lactobacillus intestinalis]KAI4308827.1 hypothetical protein C821_000495 [Lactobacillus intestinalis]